MSTLTPPPPGPGAPDGPTGPGMPPTPPPGSGPNTGLIIGIIAVAVIAIGAGVFFFLRGGDSTPAPGPTPEPVAAVMVPSVLGSTLEEATKTLEKEGFIVGTVTSEPSEYADTTVLSQSPPSGEKLPKGSAISLTVAGPAEPVIPSVEGQTLDQAQATLADAGFTLGEYTLEPNSAPANTVLKQSPKAGESAPKGSAVNLTVSNGKVAVPDVVGLTEARATAKLEDAGFKVKSQDAKPSEGKKGTVVKTNPTGGKTAEVGTTVVISVVPKG